MSKSTHPRRIAREAVLQALYAYEITKEKRDKVLNDIINRQSYDNDMKNFITSLFNFSIDNKEWCEEQSEIHFVDDVPPKVSISEAIEIAKQYSTEESAGFVNGVLDNIYKTMENKVEAN